MTQKRGLDWTLHGVVLKSVFWLHVLNKNENVINAFARDLLKMAKCNSQQEKPLCPNHKNKFPQKTKKWPIRRNKLPQKFHATW